MNSKETISLDFVNSPEDQTLLTRICSSAKDEDRTHVDQAKHLLEMALGIKAPDLSMWKRLRPHQVAEYLKERGEIAERQAIMQEQTAKETAQKEDSDPLRRACQRLDDLRGYCRTIVEEYEENDEFAYMFSCVESRVIQTLTDLKFNK